MMKRLPQFSAVAVFVLVCGLAAASAPAADSFVRLLKKPAPPAHPDADSPAERDAAATDSKPAAPDPLDPAVQRQVDAVQATLKQAEQQLQARLNQLGQQLSAAAQKGDVGQIKRIEAVQQRVIKEYEQRVEQIIRAAELTSPTRQGGAPTGASQRSASSRRAPASTAQPRAQQQPQSQQQRPRTAPAPSSRGGFRLFRFGG